MDISVFKAIISELAQVLTGKRLVEIAEGENGEFYLLFKGNGAKTKGNDERITLIIAPRPQSPRIHILSLKPKKPRKSTPFGQGLANLLLGANLLSIKQEGLERAALFNFSRETGKNEAVTTLVFEVAGKKPELIALDGEGKILLAQSYTALEGIRPILPGLAYQPPPKPPGLSPLLIREAAAACGPDPDRLAEALKGVLHRLDEEEFQPRIYETDKGPVLAAWPLLQLGNASFRSFPTVNEAAEAFYTEAEARREFQSAKSGLLRKLKTELSGARKKAAAIEDDLANTEKAEQYQLYAQTLMASLKDVPERGEQVRLTDYTTGNEIGIPLDPKRSAVENAQEYFKKAKKARAGERLLRERLTSIVAESDILARRLTEAEGAEDMERLRRLLPSPQAPGKQKQLKNLPPEFPSFTTSDGYAVLIGKNSKMNDLLTFKAARSMDLWLHAQGYRGSHVVVKNPSRRPDIPLATILQAAQAAAYYSEAKKDNDVPVDYTFVKYVRKIKGGAPGAVIFTMNKTVFVEPKKRELS